MNLTTEEEAIVINYRKLSTSQKKAVLESQWSFERWLKNSVKWVWEKIAEYGIHEMIGSLFDYLRQQFF
jgi:hypothetical protein